MGTKTPRFNLNQFEGEDKPKWLQTYNEDMAEIDARGLDRATYDPANINGNAFLSSNHKMTGYARASEFTPVVSGDSPLSAIGKLEAGVVASGDMRKAVYDTNGDGVVDHAEVADEANSVAWASVVGRPVALPNPNALTIQLGGVTATTYTGSAAATVNATPASIGAASLVGGRVPAAQLPISSATDSDSATDVANSLAVKTVSDATKGEIGRIDTALVNKASLAAEQLANRIYPGVDLSVKFTTEIAGYNDVWAWIKARIQAANFLGVNVGDYIPFTAGGNNIKAEIAGIDTYYNYGDTAAKHHIDFISRDCWPDTIQFNLVNYNNGTTVSPSPWLASNLYAKLNSLSMQVPNATTANPALVAVDYTTTGVYDKLPAALKAVISPKRLLLPSRYTAGALLTDDNSWAWADAGKLWIPSEIEVYGCTHWGSRNGYSGGGFQQYAIFATNMKRVKGAGDGGSRSGWWLLSAYGGYSTHCAIVYSYGDATNSSASYTSIRVPVCFRIA